MSPYSASEESIGQRLKRLRLERHLSQRELASPGVSYAYISRIEAGTRQPSVKALRRLATKLGVTAEYLETGSEIGATELRELRLANAELAIRLGDSQAALDSLEEVLAESVAAGDRHMATRARIALASVAAEQSDHRRAVELLEAALTSEPFSPVDNLDFYGELGRSYAASGHPEKAVEFFERCLEELRGLPHPDSPTETRYAVLLSYALSDMGDLARAESVVQDALESAQDYEADPYMRVRLYWSLARLLEMEGKSSAALHYVRRAIALLEATEDTIHLARAHLLCAWIMTSQGKAKAALAQLTKAEALLGPHPTTDDAADLRVEWARAQAALGNGAETVAAAREALELLGDSRPAELGAAHEALAEGLTLQGDFAEAGEAFARAVGLLEDQRQWREATQACQAWGRMLRHAGRDEEALDVLERASELSLRVAPAAAATDR